MDKPSFPDKTITVASSGEPSLTIGPYHLLQKIGEGGMGEVWVAEQHRPIHRRVAVKLVKPGMDTAQVMARFESERQALASMDHPAIAKIFDAGTTERGRPYFVMEYVKGIPITAYCDQNHLTTQERLALFMRACEGVQHAHQKAIIHRDIKPSNILVAIEDGKAVPKIIDFGVAKATAQSLTERTVFTELGMMIGTPEYMSPEQAEMSGQNIDTRTDVYSLGAILYELLVGALPFDPKELRRAGFDEIRRKIREEQPPKPSTRLSTMGEAQTVSAQNRRTEPPTLMRQIRGDLDWITMKALEKDRTRRYGSPSELAADIERFLDHQPIIARPPSTLYRAGRFARRHRVGVGAAATLALLLIVFSTVTAIQANRIARERDKANQEAEASRQVTDFLTGLFRVSDPSEARGNSITAREILDKGADKVGRELAGQPRIQGRLMFTMGRVYESLGLYQRANLLLEKALEIARSNLGGEHPDVAKYQLALAWLYRFQGRGKEAIPLCRSALALLEKNPGTVPTDMARAVHIMAVLLRDKGDYEEARALFERSRAIYVKALGPDDIQVAYSHYHQGWLLKLMGDLGEAKHSYERALSILEKTLPPGHPDLAWCLNDLSVVYENMGDYDSARQLLEQSLATKEKVFGPEHPAVAASLKNLGVVLWRMGKYDQAKPLYERALSIEEKALGPEHAEVAGTLNNLALLAQDTGNYPEARRLYDRSLELLLKVYGPEHSEVAASLSNMAELFGKMGDYVRASALYKRSLAVFEKVFGAEHPEVASVLRSLAGIYVKTGDYTLAGPLYERSLGIREKAAEPDKAELAGTMEEYAALLRKVGRSSEAEKLEARAKSIRQQMNSGTQYLLPNFAFRNASPLTLTEPILRNKVRLVNALAPTRGRAWIRKINRDFSP
jgi:non-specific serine/threonine protein kinase/serine/threonine-protein kinase